MFYGECLNNIILDYMILEANYLYKNEILIFLYYFEIK